MSEERDVRTLEAVVIGCNALMQTITVRVDDWPEDNDHWSRVCQLVFRPVPVLESEAHTPGETAP